MICPSCGRENRDDARFCDECAASLTTSSADQVATPAFDGFAPSEGFVGRLQELAELKVALDDAMCGRGRLVMLAGEPGIGKTRTTQELASYAETRRAPRSGHHTALPEQWLRGRAPAPDRSEGFHQLKSPGPGHG